VKKGNLHSIETMGLVDGPGIRTVFFLQGCPLRCAYCHNPDTQNNTPNKTISTEEIKDMAIRYKPYYKTSGGGVTFSGGEPLLQGEFLAEAVKELKKEDICVTIDTCGFGDERYYQEILDNTNLIMLDIKHFENDGYKKLTGSNMSKFYKFLSYLDNYEGRIWIRHVMVPGITDNEDSMYRIFDEISHLSNKIDRIEILPYHRMGVHKYEELNIEYKLKDVPEMDKEAARYYENIISKLLEDSKKKMHKQIV